MLTFKGLCNTMTSFPYLNWIVFSPLNPVGVISNAITSDLDSFLAALFWKNCQPFADFLQVVTFVPYIHTLTSLITWDNPLLYDL